MENEQLLQLGHAYQLSICMNVKTIDAHEHIDTMWNDRETKRIDIETIVETKQNVNFYWLLLHAQKDLLKNMYMTILYYAHPFLSQP